MNLGNACKAIVFPLVTIAEMGDRENFRGNREQRGGAKAKYYLAYAVNVILLIAAGYLAWNCNAGESTAMRILYTVLALIFSGFYLIYYLIYHVLMGRACVGGNPIAAV
jgi:cytochrome b subunit of formate dehydrogenase